MPDSFVPYEQLCFLKTFSPGILHQTSRRHRNCKVFLWHGQLVDEEAVRELCAMAHKLVAEDCIVEELRQYADSVVTLSEWDVKLSQLVNGHHKESVNREAAILFCPHNDTHAKMFAPVARHIPGSRFLVFNGNPKERSAETLEALGISFIEGDHAALRKLNPACVVFGNDWGLEKARRILEEARRQRIPSVVLQEGCLDFGTRVHRMERADFPLIQGPIMARYFQRKCYMLTGNPRYDDLLPVPLPAKPKVMINSNFTYGVFEEERDNWIQSAVAACETLGVDFFICQHPRDKGVFPGHEVRRSDATKIKSFIEESSVLISRFSTVIYEAMYMGRQVVYHNPHGEKMRLFNEDQSRGIFQTRTHDEAAKALAAALEPASGEQQEKFNRFLRLHCGTRDGRAAERVAVALAHIASNARPWDTVKEGLFAKLKKRFV